MQADVPLAFASDWPVVPLGPLLGMYTAVHRRSPDMPAAMAWQLEGGVTPEQAMLAHTKGAAFACGMENSVGMLRRALLSVFSFCHSKVCQQNTVSSYKHAGLNRYSHGTSA